MPLILVLRHAEYVQDEYVYSDDFKAPLTKLGSEQAYSAREIVQLFNPEVVYSSNHLRALQTTALAYSGGPSQIRISSELRERSFATLYGMTASDIRNKHGGDFLQRLQLNKDTLQMDDEESLEEAARRVWDFFQDIRMIKNSRILVVTHGGPHSWLCCQLLNLPINECRKFSLGHARFSLFDIDKSKTDRILALNFSDPEMVARF